MAEAWSSRKSARHALIMSVVTSSTDLRRPSTPEPGGLLTEGAVIRACRRPLNIGSVLDTSAPGYLFLRPVLVTVRFLTHGTYAFPEWEAGPLVSLRRTRKYPKAPPIAAPTSDSQ